MQVLEPMAAREDELVPWQQPIAARGGDRGDRGASGLLRGRWGGGTGIDFLNPLSRKKGCSEAKTPCKASNW